MKYSWMVVAMSLEIHFQLSVSVFESKLISRVWMLQCVCGTEMIETLSNGEVWLLKREKATSEDDS